MTTFWTWLNRLVCFLIFVSLVMAAGLKYLPLLRANQARRADIERKRAHLEVLEARHRQLQAEIHALRNDPKAVERAAREVLGYARPDEWVVTFEKPSP
jgi:cell division protein FtsB